MRLHAGTVRLSATDLSNHLACRHLTQLDLDVARGNRPAPNWKAPDAIVLQQRGAEHESAYLNYLRTSAATFVDLREIASEAIALVETRRAMMEGVHLIAQAAFQSENWFGRADVLRRVPFASNLGDWSYEVCDCKLARETKAATILQLSVYSELVGAVQGVLPQWMYVVPPGFAEERYRVQDFAAYYRSVRARLEESVANPQIGYPEPAVHCDICRWWEECERRRRADDHLGFVAGITRLQRKQLEVWEARTLAALAKFPVPLKERPQRGSRESYERVREQARVQAQGRASGQPVHELLDLRQEAGLAKLPEPSLGDIFFDLEGDPFVGNNGREYLFGFVADSTYQCHWAFTPAEEKRAFEWFTGFVMDRWAQYPGLHIYHYNSYEPSAMRRLMGQYATCEDEVDRMLRANLFVDLRTVAKQSVRASVEQYSLKALEAFHGFTRQVSLEDARHALRRIEHALELERDAEVDGNTREVIAGYNADDCLSTLSLRDWLERLRKQLLDAGSEIARPAANEGAPPPDVNERQQRVATLFADLTRGIPVDPSQRAEEQNASWLLANLLDWHRRESKADYWEYLTLREKSAEDLMDEKSALAGLTFIERVGREGRLAVDRYSFEKQETDIRADKALCYRGDAFGDVVAIDVAWRTVDIRKKAKMADVHPDAVFADTRGPLMNGLGDALFRLGTWINEHGWNADGPFRAERDLLLRRPPRLGGAPLRTVEETTEAAARRLVLQLDSTTLAIQGPPGAGKTYTGARMIRDLLRHGKRVGVTAYSHKVIRNLLDEVMECADQGLRCVQKVSKKSADAPAWLREVTDNKNLAEAEECLIAGTAWLWCREEMAGAVDVLFVDEAGQMSLANVLATAQAAGSVVLLGDPQQLEQPLRGSHPDGAELSALEHLLDGAFTIPPDRGLFLDHTWRLHPEICRFTSEVFYEGRLEPRECLGRQKLEGHAWLGNAGLRFVPVSHEGNQNSSPEEVEQVAELVKSLLDGRTQWVNGRGESSPLRLEDVLIVSPYNAQVSDLAVRIPGARVGTVDKFQGQEAPLVIYSLTTSSPEDAPRGMEFLYSLNRLNVATSRAKVMAIVVGSPRLLEPECRTPRQMKLANGLCRFVEIAGSSAAGGFRTFNQPGRSHLV